MILLASQSPRRQELLTFGGWRFRVASASVDERSLPGESSSDYVSRVAESKARAVFDQAQPGWLVLGADTAVVIDGRILGKPADVTDAVRILQQLRGRDHLVFTAIVLLRAGDGALMKDLCVTQVPMRRYSDEEIKVYVASGDAMDKAGAYAIQHPGFRPVTDLDGCYANVMGLPVCHLVRTLATWGFSPTQDVPEVCQVTLAYRCPVYRSILRGEL